MFVRSMTDDVIDQMTMDLHAVGRRCMQSSTYVYCGFASCNFKFLKLQHDDDG